MPIIFMKKGCRKSFQSCDYDFSEKVNLKEHTDPVHIKKRLNQVHGNITSCNCSTCGQNFTLKCTLIKILNRLMRTRIHIDALFVATIIF